MSLETELAKFWEWANMTPETYNEQRGLGEWEVEYPGWEVLYKVANEALEQLNQEFNHDLAQLLVYALSIDNEAGLLLKSVEEKLDDKLRFVRKAVYSDQPQARWQMAELLSHTEVEGREKMLLHLINSEEDKYVKRRALLSLSQVNPTKAIELAKPYVRDTDPFLKLVAKEIIKKKV
ncbi:HEAT repeat domain-containing protein [Pontibacter sp. JH31]|uniref:HEAT repeat domain-containing protein n=1 Tax=Pontibacter aquaedesilientis TaxID=2766980 RepID=A0ABR7XFX9_9BACT|nr:HEAT repeat domain-containing protein [Pontibacter aquaedesilientis]MBD1397200.1 HEAT repeat domain-containing protein [Pontibacter aquaedesilientis]